MYKVTRRRFIQGTTGLLAMHAMPVVATLRSPTPRQSAGPFYPEELPLDDDNDLTHVAGQQQTASGQITDLDGRILDQNGRPLGGVRIEIWQCDINGRYRHPRDTSDLPIDPAFQGIGHTISDRLGRYRFRTIRPMSYPGRTPHIHVAVFPTGEKLAAIPQAFPCAFYANQRLVVKHGGTIFSRVDRQTVKARCVQQCQ
jgi:protocatechuate 3,4-dioxygenase beta subunit